MLRCAAMYYGLTTESARSLAYQYAESISAPMPRNWRESKCAGIEWLRAFRARHPELTLRRPFSTSIARASAFNEYNVGRFFENYSAVMDKHHFAPNRIYNMDETGFSTVPSSHSKVICMKGVRQIGAIASAERGQMMTVALAVSADGNQIPPFFIFPRAKMQAHYLNNAPLLSAATANPSGWMMAPDFMKFISHFHRMVKPSVDDPVLLLLDNHDSHMSIGTLKFCKENGIVVVSFPPHCTHRLQPLDRTVFGALKGAYNKCCENFLRTHNRPIRMDDIPGIVKSAIEIGVLPVTIRAGFQTTGIFPVNPNIFTEADFLPSSVSDRDSYGYVPETEVRQASAPIPPEEHTDIIGPDEPLEETRNVDDSLPSSPDYNQTLQDIAPYPKAPPRVQSTRGRKKRRTAILTDDAVMKQLEDEQNAVAERKAKAAERKVNAAARKVHKLAESLAKSMAPKDKPKPKPKPRISQKDKREAGPSSGQKTTRGRPKKKAKPPTPSSTSEDTDIESMDCYICNKLIGRSKYKPCPKCSRIAHRKCGPQDHVIACKNCDSDMDLDELE